MSNFFTCMCLGTANPGPLRCGGLSIDRLWRNIAPSFPTLSKFVKGGLSVFHGRLVESSFNTIGNIIDLHSTRMDIAIHYGFQTAQYHLRRYSDVMECLNQI